MASAREKLLPRGLSTLAVGVTGVCGAWLLVTLGQVSSRLQFAAAIVLTVVPAAVLVFLWRPDLLIAAFILVIPLLVERSVEASLNAGQAATLLVVGVGLPSLIARRNQLPPFMRRIVWPLFGLGLLGLVSVIWNGISEPADVANAVFKYFTFALVALLVYVHVDSPKKAHLLMRVLLWGAALAALYSVFAYLTGRSFYPEYGYSRASGTFEHWNTFGGYMALMIFPMATYGFSRRGTWVQPLCILAVGIQLVALLLSLTLGSVLGVGIAFIFGLLYFFRRGVGQALVLVTLAALIFILIWTFVPAVGDHFNEADSRVDDRVNTYSAGLYLLRSNWFLGVGGQDQVLQEVLALSAPGLSRVTVVPHNAFLAIGVEKGVVGVALLAFLFTSAFRFLVRRSFHLPQTHRLWHYGIALGSTAFLIQNMSNLLFLHARLGLIWIVMLALDVRLHDLARGSEERAGRLQEGVE